MKNLTDEQLKTIIVRMGHQMTSSSNSRMIGLEKERTAYVKELMRRGLGGYPSKKKYRRLSS